MLPFASPFKGSFSFSIFLGCACFLADTSLTLMHCMFFLQNDDLVIISLIRSTIATLLCEFSCWWNGFLWVWLALLSRFLDELRFIEVGAGMVKDPVDESDLRLYFSMLSWTVPHESTICKMFWSNVICLTWFDSNFFPTNFLRTAAVRWIRTHAGKGLKHWENFTFH